MIDLSSHHVKQHEQYEIRYPSSIQNHGILIVVDYNTLNIIQVSENLKLFLEIEPSFLLGKPLKYLLYPKQIQNILASLAIHSHDFVDIIKIKKSKNNLKFQGTIHTIQDSIILELEPLIIGKKGYETDLYNLLNNAILNISAENKLEETYQIITQEIRKITQFDRVLIYRFNFDSSGVVIAEDKKEDIESYLGLHYPSYDIPTPAREFYASNWLRIICDVSAEPIKIIPSKHPLKNEELDLSRSILRSVFPCHIQYLKNMGVKASMSISLLNQDKLWGLIACHHYSPKYINYETRKVGEFLGQFLSAHLFCKQEQQFKTYHLQIQGIQNRLRKGLLKTPDLVGEVFAKNKNSLIKLTKSEGLAICLDKNINLMGNTPTQQQVEDLIKNVLEDNQQEVFFTDSLVTIYPPAQQFKDKGCGILSISLFLTNHTYHLIWFRPEQSYQVPWAGNPYNVTIENINDIPQLTPRHSFTLWKETVKNKSFPWELVEIDAAQELRKVLLLTALEFSQYSQTILEETTKQANAANLAKSQFLAKMSHELRTPLNAILGFTQMMNRDCSVSEVQKEYLGIINRSGEHLLSLINDVLEMSRIEAGQITLNHSCFNLYDLIKSVRELLTIKSHSKGLCFTVEQDVELPQYLEGDESKLRQIIVNLVGNAIKFTEEGNVDLIISLLSYSKNSKNVELLIEVKDTGIGIDNENLETIFEPFKQTDNSIHSKEGTGLGLSISRQFARLMDGDIIVRSKLGEGSIFTCRIGMNLPERITHKTDAKQIIGLSDSQPIYRILVVEDVRDNRLLMEKMLDSVGFDVKTAENGKEAIALWEKWQPDLIWMDMRMPVMDGYEASRHIRTREAIQGKKRKSVPIIALTATAFDEERKAILEVGCNDFVSKPFQEKDIFEIMAKYLGVEYIYQSCSEKKLIQSQAPTVDNQKLQTQIQQMPSTWKNQLRKAALSAREIKLNKLITEIPPEFSLLAHNLTYMLNNLSFEQIANLIEVNHE
ncbi:multi-sensor hybrid histidine kinase [Cyanobacterium stanieri PCC 7202]|uniref:Circadian input-output histidine kinase CikA n=1 Tax=Cyanobacterium stanieri (strain ATCC 29140 / PCC 7202) TaxID=292563 RepID=K9YKE2_CYASC|nr:multi-sensor hybrid histidine kinase [Cyanobacterium stanieri PCC 7202]